MGHIRLGVLPKYPKWKSVIILLGDADVPVAQLADKVLDGSQDMLQSDSAQSSVSYCIWLLAQLTLASRKSDFGSELAKLGIQVDDRTTASLFLAKIAQSSSRQLSDFIPHTALNNIAGLALRETLTRLIGSRASTLFGAGLPEIQAALREYSTNRQFSAMVHVFFTSFLCRTLRLVVDKEIANHVGEGKRFETIQELGQFEDALEGFAGQTSRIVDQFSGGWYSKRIWQKGSISETDAAGFVHVALDKLTADLKLSEVQQ